jgi:hypothetical protein
VNILTPSIPKRLTITDGMWEDLVWDPVMGAEILLGYKFDAFQRVRLRIKWFCPFVIDSSGYGTGKTVTDWAHDQLRAMLIPDQVFGVFYPTGETGRNSYWTYYDACQSKYLHAHLGGRTTDEDDAGSKATTRGSACYKARFKNGSEIRLPSPNFMKGSSSQASQDYNVVILEEWTHVDADAVEAGKVSGIDKQLIGRARRPNWNKNHPIWGNKIHFSAPAKPRQHHAYKRYAAHERRANGTLRGEHLVGGGNPDNFVLAFSHKDWSGETCVTGKTFRDQYRDDKNLAEVRTGLSNDAEWLGEGFGIWSSSGSGWYTDDDITNAQAMGRAMGLQPLLVRETRVEN